MSDSAEMWRTVKEKRKARLDESHDQRVMKLTLMLANHPELVLVRELGAHGVRLSRVDWPEGKFIDFWPRTLRSGTHDGTYAKGWTPLLRYLGVR